MSSFPIDERFVLIREAAENPFRARLAQAGRLSREVIAARRTPAATDIGNDWAELIFCLKFYEKIIYEDQSSHFIFRLEGVDSCDYLLRIAAAVDGFDVFTSSATMSYFYYPDDPSPLVPYSKGTADYIERFLVEGAAVERAYLAGLKRIAGHIQENQRAELGSSPAENAASPGGSASLPAWPFALTNPATIDASFLAYAVGIMGAAAMMASGLGPGWLGFVAAFVPASLLAAWAVAPHA